jgi:hypothetical protein
MSNEQRKITRLQFGQLLSKAKGRSATTGNGVSGFRATGIHPFDPSAIPEHAFKKFLLYLKFLGGKDSKRKQPATVLTSKDCLAKNILSSLKRYAKNRETCF